MLLGSVSKRALRPVISLLRNTTSFSISTVTKGKMTDTVQCKCGDVVEVKNLKSHFKSEKHLLFKNTKIQDDGRRMKTETKGEVKSESDVASKQNKKILKSHSNKIFEASTPTTHSYPYRGWRGTGVLDVTFPARKKVYSYNAAYCSWNCALHCFETYQKTLHYCEAAYKLIPHTNPVHTWLLQQWAEQGYPTVNPNPICVCCVTDCDKPHYTGSAYCSKHRWSV